MNVPAPEPHTQIPVIIILVKTLANSYILDGLCRTVKFFAISFTLYFSLSNHQNDQRFELLVLTMAGTDRIHSKNTAKAGEVLGLI
jgi:hypothetical protein